jgi:hypothetical protein
VHVDLHHDPQRRCQSHPRGDVRVTLTQSWPWTETTSIGTTDLSIRRWTEIPRLRLPHGRRRLYSDLHSSPSLKSPGKIRTPSSNHNFQVVFHEKILVHHLPLRIFSKGVVWVHVYLGSRLITRSVFSCFITVVPPFCMYLCIYNFPKRYMMDSHSWTSQTCFLITDLDGWILDGWIHFSVFVFFYSATNEDIHWPWKLYLTKNLLARKVCHGGASKSTSVRPFVLHNTDASPSHLLSLTLVFFGI